MVFRLIQSAILGKSSKQKKCTVKCSCMNDYIEKGQECIEKSRFSSRNLQVGQSRYYR